MKVIELNMINFVKETISKLKDKNLKPTISELFYTFENSNIFDIFGFGTPSLKFSAQYREFSELISQGCKENILNPTMFHHSSEDTAFSEKEIYLNPWCSYPENVEIWMDRDPLMGHLRSLCHDLNIKYITNICDYKSYFNYDFFFSKIKKKTRVLLVTDFSPGRLSFRKTIKKCSEKFNNIKVENIFVDEKQINNPAFSPYKTLKLALKDKKYLQEYGKKIILCESLPPELIIQTFKEKVFSEIDEKQFMDFSELCKKTNNKHSKEILNAKRSLYKKFQIPQRDNP